MLTLENNYQADGLNFSFKKLTRDVKKNVASVKKDVSLNNIVKTYMAPTSLITGVKINGMSDVNLNNQIKIVAKTGQIGVAFVPGVGPVLAGVAGGVLSQIAEKGSNIGFRDISIKNGANIAVSAGTAYATAGIGRGLTKLGGKIADGAIGRGADGIVNKLANTGAGKFVNKYANTTVGQIVTNQGKKLIKNAENKIVDSITGAIVGTATNLLIKPESQGNFADYFQGDRPNYPIMGGTAVSLPPNLRPQSDGMTYEQHLANVAKENNTPSTSQIETIAKLSDKPVEQVASELNAKTTDTTPPVANDAKGMSTGVKIAGGLAVAGLIWYLVK